MKHKWSDRFSRKNSVIRTIKSLIRYSSQYSKRHKIKDIIMKFRKHSEVMSMETNNILSNIPQSLSSDDEWRSFQKQSINLLRKTQKGLHMRARVKWRQQMKNLKSKRENQRKNQQEVKQYYNYVLKRKSHTSKPTHTSKNSPSLPERSTPAVVPYDSPWIHGPREPPVPVQLS